MSLNSALADGRAAAASLAREQVRIYRPGEDVFDRETGMTVPGPPLVTWYEGQARVKVAQLAAQQVDVAEAAEVQLRQYRISLPFDTELPEEGRPEPGDLVDVVASPDPRMAGLRLWVVGVQYSSTATAWRIIAEDRQS